MPQTGQQDDPTVVRSLSVRRCSPITVVVIFVLGLLIGYGAHYLQTSSSAGAGPAQRAN